MAIIGLILLFTTDLSWLGMIILVAGGALFSDQMTRGYFREGRNKD